MQENKEPSRQKYRNLLETLSDICVSRQVTEIVVGLTKRPNSRKAKYLRRSYNHFVILLTKKSVKIALAAENELFNSIQNDKSWCSIKRKYHAKKMQGRYYPSIGNAKIDSNEEYSVYVAWKRKSEGNETASSNDLRF